MAELFLGRVRGPSGFSRPVVLKRILPHLARQPKFVDMFLDEARIVARVRHPNVVQVTELTHEGDELFMVMEYLEGESVSGVMRRLVSKADVVPPAMAAFVIAEACAGLHAAHELAGDDGKSLGVVHRDVSPQNLFITFDGAVKVLDFGIARAADRVARTEAGQVKGKLDYMSPEQCLSLELDRRSDVFALGAVLYELLTLRRLFRRPAQLGTMKAIIEEPVVPPSRLNEACSAEIDRIVLRALAKERDERYQTAAEFRRDLLQAAVVQMPQEALAALMQRLFTDRKLEKDEMLRRVGEGSIPSALPPAEVDDGVDVPEVEAPLETNVVGVPASLVPSAPPPTSRRGPVLIAVVVLALLGAGFAFTRSKPEPVAEVPTVVVAPPVVVAPAEPEFVQLTIESTPPGAAVRFAGQSHGVTPVVINAARGDAGVLLEVSLEKHQPVQRLVTPEADQRLMFGLTRVVAPASKSKPKPGSNPLDEKW